MDFAVYKWVNGLANQSDRFEDVLQAFALYAQYFFIALLAALFLARGKWRSINARHGVVAAGFAALLALGIGDVLNHLWIRPRPYVAHPGDAHLFVTPSNDPSFPSDHATAAFAIAVSILLRHRRAGLLALGMATVVALSRVVVGVHYPSDVLAGAAIGTAAALFFWWPPVREPLHRFADWAADVYDRIATWGLRRA
jgi:undecaprenyl-diphosphatase